MEKGSEPIVESMIDSNLVADGSVVEYRAKGVEFSQGEGVDIDNTLSSGFSQKAGGDLVEVVASITKGFEVHE
jgi:hypothetical protein